jgi:hypothetical protein
LGNPIPQPEHQQNKTMSPVTRLRSNGPHPLETKVTTLNVDNVKLKTKLKVTLAKLRKHMQTQNENKTTTNTPDSQDALRDMLADSVRHVNRVRIKLSKSKAYSRDLSAQVDTVWDTNKLLTQTIAEKDQEIKEHKRVLRKSDKRNDFQLGVNRKAGDEIKLLQAEKQGLMKRD